MRRFDRSFDSFPNPVEERRLAVPPRDDGWVKSSLEQIATTQNKLRLNVSQNSENIVLCRQENIAVAENLRTAANMWQQFGEKVSRLADQMDYERGTMESSATETKQKFSTLTSQYRQLMNGGVQVERSVSKLEEEVLRLKQNNEQANKRIQLMNDKVNDAVQQLSKLNDAMDIGIQDLRQLSHHTEINTKKNVRAMLHDIEHKIENEEQERREDNMKVFGKLSSLEAIVQDLKKSKKLESGSYAALIEEKDQEYKAELKNFLKKVKNHVEEQQYSSSSTRGGFPGDVGKKLRAIEKRLEKEEEERAEALQRLEEETAKHFKRVSDHIIQRLDSLGSSLNTTSPSHNLQQELLEMRKEIEENKKSINRVLRAEISARKSQAEKLNNSIEGFEKQNSKTAIILKDAMTEIKTYVDKELEAKTNSPGDIHPIIPNLDKRLSDVEEKLIRKETDSKKPDSPAGKDSNSFQLLEERFSDLEKTLNNHKTDFDKELRSNKESIKSIFPIVEKRLSDAEMKLAKKHDKCEKPDPPAGMERNSFQLLEERFSDLEKTLNNHKTVFDKELRSNKESIKSIFPIVEKRLSDAEMKLAKKHEKCEKPDPPAGMERNSFQLLEERFSDLEKTLNNHKTVFDKELRSNKESIKSIFPIVEKRLSDAELKLAKKHEKCEQSSSSDKDSAAFMPYIESRLSDIEEKLKQQRSESKNSFITEEGANQNIYLLERELNDVKEILKQHDKKIQRSDESCSHVLRVIPPLERELKELAKKIRIQERMKSPIVSKEFHNDQIYYLEKVLVEMKETIIEHEEILKAGTRTTPPTSDYSPEVVKRLSRLEEQIKWQMSMIMMVERISKKGISEYKYEKPTRIQTADCHKPRMPVKPPQVRRNSSFLRIDTSKVGEGTSHLKLSRDRLLKIERQIQDILDNQEETENDIAVLQRRTKREMMLDRRIRNKLVEFVNKRCMEGARIHLFIKHFGVHHLKYFMDYTGKKILVNKWGMYQALRMYQIKKKWLGLIGKQPNELSLKEYREIIREEREKERERARKEKKKPISPIVFDTESSESEPEPESEPIKQEEEATEPKEEVEEKGNEEEEGAKEPEGPVRINYEDDNSGDDYIKYKTDDEDDETDDEFFPQTSEDEEDSKLFSDEDEDDDTADEEENEDGDEEGEEKDGNEENDGQDENDEDKSGDEDKVEEEKEDDEENEGKDENDEDKSETRDNDEENKSDDDNEEDDDDDDDKDKEEEDKDENNENENEDKDENVEEKEDAERDDENRDEEETQKEDESEAENNEDEDKSKDKEDPATDNEVETGNGNANKDNGDEEENTNGNSTASEPNKNVDNVDGQK